MEDVKLTNEADFLLCGLYKEYLERRKADMFREEAVIFGSAENLQQEIVQDWPIQDIEDVVRELSRAEIVTCLWADNTFWHASLTTNGIIYMETRFGRKIDKVLSRLNALKSLLAF